MGPSSDRWSDPQALSLDELRAERARLHADEDALSYVRRLAQGRIDVVRAEMRRRAEQASGASSGDLSGELPRILSTHLVGGSGRPPRETHIPSDHPLVTELDAFCDSGGFDELPVCTDQRLGVLLNQLIAWEADRSAERHHMFERIDALTAELVRRYRDGDASVDSLLAEG